MKIQAVILAGGVGSRAKQNVNKVLSIIDGESVIFKTVSTFLNNSKIDSIILAYRDNDKEILEEELKIFGDKITFVQGGKTRFGSVKNALQKADCDIVLIHDGARPFVTNKIIENCIEGVMKFGSAIASIPSSDTLLNIDEKGNILGSERSSKLRAQTPQAFIFKDILYAYNEALEEENFTDDCGVYCKYVGNCHPVEGDINNIKLTYPEDFECPIKVGCGFDLHTLIEGRKLILGGIEIEHTKGLLGHSDADVLTHAIMDALLSSVCMRDIGYHFSDKDPKYLNANSINLLKEVLKMIKEKGYAPSNISAVIMAQKPKLSPYVNAITENLAKVLGLNINCVGITCTTLEGIGIVGREEGIAVQAYCSVKKVK